MKNIKHDFPIFKNHPDLIYLDSSATSQKPQVVIDAVSSFYEKNNSNIHRGIYDLSQIATDMYENVRKKVAGFIGATTEKEIVFTSGATESINFVAYGYAEKFLQEGDSIVISEMEHHSNIVPWQRLKEKKNIDLIFLPITTDGRLDYKSFTGDFSKVKLLALTHVSNVLGTINPTTEIVSYFKKHGSDAKILIDAAQSLPHLAINVEKLDCDFLVFSSHKMLGPSGVGVLWAKKELLEVMDPLLVGSQMIKRVKKESVLFADVPQKFETGTGNIEGVVGFGTAIDYLQNIGMQTIEDYEKELTEYAIEMFAKQKDITLFGPTTSENRISVFSFAVGNVHAHDTAEILNRLQIAVRSGHHCAQVLMDCLQVSGTTRASFYLYNTKEDIDALIKGIEEVKKTFRI
jgi:cysteine desulfurase / selenocysteine lyase